jgi:MFS transporter, BCD family, chlorophyll transporter
LPAMLPGALVALHYFVQMLRPRFGHGSDVGGKRTPWIIGGMAVLATGGILAALATALMATHVFGGVVLAVIAFLLIGVGVGAAGTSLLVLVAKSVDADRRAPAATIMWVMMIAGFIVTAGLAGHFLDPFTQARLVAVTVVVATTAFCLAGLAVWGVERSVPAHVEPSTAPTRTREIPFRAALARVWQDVDARRFTVFVFISMLAYSAQDLILEPFAGLVFGLTPGQSTKLSALQNSGVLAGMILVAVAGTAVRKRFSISLPRWTVGGCVASALALISVALAGAFADESMLRLSVLALGFGNGVFAVSAIGSMMELAGAGPSGRASLQMGLWGASQAIAFGLGGLAGAAGVDLARVMLASPMLAYGAVFAAEALLFLVAARLALRIGGASADSSARERSSDTAFEPAAASGVRAQ